MCGAVCDGVAWIRVQGDDESWPLFLRVQGDGES